MIRSSVPCAGCTACCKNELLILHPEMGDDPANYETMAVINPLDRKPAVAIKMKPNGDCWYLGEDGCTIHDRAPAICKEFDCRKFVQRLGNRADRRKFISQTGYKPDVINAGLKRMDTL